MKAKMRKICEKKEFVILYNDYKDEYVVYNRKLEWKTENDDKHHTHCNNLKVAYRLIDYAINKKIGKKMSKYFIESLMRISKDERYKQKLQNILEGKEPKEVYYNKSKAYRKR